MPKPAPSYNWPEFVGYKGNRYRINHSYDQPYVAGSDRACTTIFFDRHWDPVAEVDGRPMDRLLPVVAHEVEENRAEHAGKPYLVAHHQFAEPAERQMVLQMGHTWMSYQDSFKSEIRRCEHEYHPHMPKDEEAKPYIGTRFMQFLRKRRRN